MSVYRKHSKNSKTSPNPKNTHKITDKVGLQPKIYTVFMPKVGTKYKYRNCFVYVMHTQKAIAKLHLLFCPFSKILKNSFLKFYCLGTNSTCKSNPIALAILFTSRNARFSLLTIFVYCSSAWKQKFLK